MSLGIRELYLLMISKLKSKLLPVVTAHSRGKLRCSRMLLLRGNNSCLILAKQTGVLVRRNAEILIHFPETIVKHRGKMVFNSNKNQLF